MAVLAIATAAYAQEEPKLVAKPSGRILFDAAYINPQHQEEDLNSGVGIPDFRVGVGFSYGKWKGKIDMGYAYGKVNMKDVWLQYDFGKTNFIRGGYFIHQYGFKSSTSSSFKETMEEPQSNACFNNDRMIGVMYEHNGKQFLATASFVVESDAMKQTTDQTGNESVGAMTRLLYRPFAERGKMFQVGISGGIEGARYNSNEEMDHTQFTLSTRWPTRVAKVNAQQAVAWQGTLGGGEETVGERVVGQRLQTEIAAGFLELGRHGQPSACALPVERVFIDFVVALARDK